MTFRYLSQYAHATPYAIASLRFQRADHEDGAMQMTIPVGLAVVCTTQALQMVGDLHPEIRALLPDAFYTFMDAGPLQGF